MATGASSSVGPRGQSALLIDLENFYLAREDSVRRSGEPAGHDFAADLEALSRFAVDLAEGRRLGVRRAYADFNSARRVDDRWDYFLRATAKSVMEQGIEPVQCFRHPGSARKNSVDIRLVVDALGLLGSVPALEQVILVSGDSDFLPLIVALRARGVHCVVIDTSEQGRPATRSVCDVFEQFGDLLVADRSAGASDRLSMLRDALRGILGDHRQLALAALRPLLNRALGHRFDLAGHGAEDLGEFLQDHARELGITLDRSGGTVVVDLAVVSGALTAPSLSSGPMRAPRHDPAEYRWLLRLRSPKIHMVDHADWLRITAITFDRCTDSGGTPIRVQHASLVEDLAQQCAQEDMEAAEKKVQSVAFQLFKAGVFVCVGITGAGTRDFHWSKPARLGDDILSVDDLRRTAARYVTAILLQRLREEYGTDEIDLDVLAEILEGPGHGEPEARIVGEIVAAARELESSPAK